MLSQDKTRIDGSQVVAVVVFKPLFLLNRNVAVSQEKKVAVCWLARPLIALILDPVYQDLVPAPKDRQELEAVKRLAKIFKFILALRFA